MPRENWSASRFVSASQFCLLLMSRASLIISANHASDNLLRRSPSKSSFNLSSPPYSTSSSSSIVVAKYSQPKSLSSPLYHLLPKTQNPNNIVDLICSALRHGNTDLSLLQTDVKALLSYLGAPEISRVLLRCQSDYSAALNFFNWVKNDLCIKTTTYNYCLIVHILTWSRKFLHSMRLLCELIEVVKDCSPGEDVFETLLVSAEDCNWDPVVFDMLIRAYAKFDMVAEGFRTFMKTVEVGFIPSVIACNHLLNGLSRLNSLDRCWLVYQEMVKVGIHPNSYTFNILTHVLCKDGDVDRVHEFLEKIEEEGFDPDLVTYNTIIGSYCRKGRLDDAFYLYRIMYRRGIMPDLVTNTALMNGLCRLGNVREAHQLFHRMVHRGLSPDVVSYNTLICGYSHEGEVQDLRSLLHEMIRNGICPNSLTCRLIIERYGKEGKLLSALNLIIELERYRVSVPQDVYNYLIIALCQDNRPFAAKSLLERICGDGFKYEPDINIYNKLIESLCKCDCVEDALVMKDEMVQKGIKPNLVTYKALICCCNRISRSMEAANVMEEMLRFGIQPDPQICSALIHVYCKEKDIDKAESLLSFFAKELQIFDTESYNALIKIASENGDAPRLMELQDKMLKAGYIPNSLTCKYVIHGLWKEKDLEKHKFHVE